MNTSRILSYLFLIAGLVSWSSALTQRSQAQSPTVRVLMLGDNGHHQPAHFFRAISEPLKRAGIQVEYSDNAEQTLNLERLNQFDALLIYANTERITESQETALLEYVESGHGFVPVHCASFCFLNSPKYIAMVGAQFKEHGGERFSTEIVEPNHEIMQGFGGFESWDETYVHHKHNTKDRTVLEVRREGRLAEGTDSEPWTWVRTQGKGRVFYTAWGHNMDTWQQPGFHQLLERGIKWSAHKSLQGIAPFVDSKRFPIPEMTTVASDAPPFTYTEVGDKIPNYTPGQKWGTLGKPITKMQDPISPRDSLKYYVTPKQFEMKIYATETDGKSKDRFAGLSGKPIAMNWDHRGRLWVCETIDYPNELQPAGKGRDRIRICEDTDGDGAADKFTVFASGLSIPTAIVCYRGGALVQDGQETVYLKDTDGDDVADMRQELITGWALGDTHGGVSNFQYGLDNWIWGMQGYNDSHPVINGERQQGFRQGFWRFAVGPAASSETAPVFAIADGKVAKERSSKFDQHSIRVNHFEFIRSTDNNTWGIGFSEEGLVFGSTANHNPSDFMPIANRYYERVNGWSPEVLQMISDSHLFNAVTPNVRQVDHHGGYTAGAGHALYTARRYPKSWWNRVAFVCEPTGHLVGTFILDRFGAGYRSTNPFNLVASHDEWAAPTMAEVGPDGNVWVIDWYNFIVQHNPTPHGFTTGKGAAYESDLRDKKYGRVYRVVYNGNEGADAKTLAAADQLVAKGLDPQNEASLVAALKHPTMLWRKAAQRLLIEKGKLSQESLRALNKLVSDSSKDEVGLNVGAIHALWVLNGVGQSIDSATLASAMQHPSAGVRRNAVAAAGNSKDVVEAILKYRLLEDSDLQVRLASLLKVSDISASTPELIDKLARPDQIVEFDTGTRVVTDRWLLDAWTSAAAMHNEALLPRLVSQKGWEPNAQLLRQIGVVAQHASRSKLNAVQFENLIVTPGDADVAAAVINGLVGGWPKDYSIKVSTACRDRLLADWLNGPLPIESKSQTLQLATLAGVEGLGEGLAKIQRDLASVFGDTSASSENRVNAAKQAVTLQPESLEVVEEVLEQITAQSAPEFSSGLLQSLNASRASGLAGALINRSRTLTPDFRKNAIRLMLSRPQSTMELLDAIEEGKLTLSDLQLDQKQALADHPDEAVRTRALTILKSKGSVPNADRQKVLDAWMHVTEESGDVANGKAMYVKHCALCHKHGDIGVNIGPNLTGMAVHPKAELLMNILDPSRSVEGNFRTYSVRTTDETVLTGMLASESKTSIEIINSQGKKEVVLRDDIEDLIASQKSLMPEGFEGQMSKVEMRDLLEFLTSKGKYVPLPIDNVATSVTTKGMFWDEKNTIERLVFADWTPKMVGEVPFILIDPQGDRVANAIMLNGPMGNFAPKMPKKVEITCQTPAVAIHILGGIGGWSYPASREGSLSMTVRLHYVDGKTEDHKLINGEHLADYIRRVDVPKSSFAFDLDGRQIRFLSIQPKSKEPLTKMELIKGDDISAPVVMGITIQTSE